MDEEVGLDTLEIISSSLDFLFTAATVVADLQDVIVQGLLLFGDFRFSIDLNRFFFNAAAVCTESYM
jgi:hypothetical protein